jgi:uncharacterized protein YbjT (DUF2867 family)
MSMTLILSGTGKSGRRVAERLSAHGVPVRLGSRSGAPPFDWNDQDTWTTALRDIASVYVAYAPDVAWPGAYDAIRSFVERAVDQGVRKLVLLSGRGEPEAYRSEHTVQASGVDWTVVRAAWFNQNFIEGWLLAAVLSGTLALPADDMPEPFVDVDDIADVAVAALSEDGHSGELYEVTGPRLLTFTDAATEISKASGRHVEYLPVSAEEYAALASAHGAPDDHVAFLTELITNVLDGRNAYVADGVERALGRPPKDFTDYARDAAASGAWNA